MTSDNERWITDEWITDEWITDDLESNLTRYQKDGRDLTPTIHQGQRIADLRGFCELSVDELAEKSGLKRSELMALEAGLQDLHPDQANQLARSMGVEYKDVWIEQHNDQSN